MTLINGVGAEAFVEQLSSFQSLQDPDARYNTMLSNVPIGTVGSETASSFANYASFPGIHEFNLTYANGTQESLQLIAASNVANFTSTTGDELWDAVCAPLPVTTDSSSKKLKRGGNTTKVSKRQAAAKELPAPSGYPKPVVKDPFNVLVGYFSEDTSLKDVAVMTISSFETSGDGIPEDETRNFAVLAQEFVGQAVAAGKSKIIIDVTGNPGGTVDSGFALLSIFFPNMTIFSATRIRSVPETQFIFDTASRAKNPDDIQNFQEAGFLISTLVQPDQKTGFASDGDFLGPFEILGVPSTAIFAEDNFIVGNATDAPINIFNKGGPLNGTEPPYKPEDIVIVSLSTVLFTFALLTTALAYRRSMFFHLHHLHQPHDSIWRASCCKRWPPPNRPNAGNWRRQRRSGAGIVNSLRLLPIHQSGCPECHGCQEAALHGKGIGRLQGPYPLAFGTVPHQTHHGKCQLQKRLCSIQRRGAHAFHLPTRRLPTLLHSCDAHQPRSQVGKRRRRNMGQGRVCLFNCSSATASVHR